MSAHTLLNLFKELGKSDKMRGLSTSFRYVTESLSILLHDVISLPGATSCDNDNNIC